MKESWVKIIQEEQIQALAISPGLCVKWARDAFLIKDEAQLPAKLSVHPQGEDFITSMPCLLPLHDGIKYFGIKVVSRIEGQIPTLQSSIYLYNALSGQLLAVMDGDWITAMRTGAVAALAARTFQKEGVGTYSMMGLGNIARAVALCLIDDNKDKHIKIRLLRYKDQADLFIERFQHYDNVSFEIIDDKRAFVSEADVLIRGFQNCDLFFDKVFGDDTGQIERFKYFKRFRQYDEFHHVLEGKNPGRLNNDERILSYNYGLGLHDIYFAARIYEKVGTDVEGFVMRKQDQKIWV